MNESTADSQGQSVRVTTGLTGIRVLEIGEMVSAPYATKLLADLGADVIKAEPSVGDPARKRGPFRYTTPTPATTNLFGVPDEEPAETETPQPVVPTGDPEASGLYLALNTNKRSVVIDNSEYERATLASLVAGADIVITNYSSERLREMGFDPEEARAKRPELVICSITPFGLTGPYAEYRAEELTVANAGGWAYQCPGGAGDSDQPPLKVFGHQTGFHSGMAAAMVTLAAYDRAERTGVGDHIDFSAMSHIAGMLEAGVIAASYMGVNPSRIGSRLLNPWGIFECDSDSRLFKQHGPNRFEDLIFLVTVEQDQWERLVEFMGNPEWVDTGLFDTLDLRLENEDLLIHYIQEWTRENSATNLWHEGQSKRICFAPVFTMAQMEQQSHLEERGFFVEVDHPVAGPIKHLGAPFRSTPDLWGPLLPAPQLDTAANPTFGPGRPKAARRPETEPRRPLEGVRVLDFSWVWAGPYCTMHLAFLGAEVIKIESALRPGLGRRLPLHPPDVAATLNTSAYFNQWDQGKLSCQLNLSTAEGIDMVKQLVRQSDVVVDNFATGVMDKLGLGYKQLSAINPNIIAASISGYGSTGPLSSYMGYGPTTGPLSGLSSLTGFEDGPPTELGIAVGDPAAGITTAFAISAALVSRRVTGQGCYIDTSLWESTASNAIEGWMSQVMTGRQPSRSGNRDPMMAPHGCYRTLDSEPSDHADSDDAVDPGQWISIACSGDTEWFKLARLIRSSLVDDKRFLTIQDRKENEDALDAIVSKWAARQDRWKLTERLQSAGIAAFPSMSPQDLLANEHLESRNFFERLHHHEVGKQTHTGLPWRSASSDNRVTRAAPLLGQHTAEVLGRLLDLTDSDLEDLRQRGITS
ncbi:MAG: CaiB/BaiF CoA transferase family protein [Acidimicrobiales bacterium]